MNDTEIDILIALLSLQVLFASMAFYYALKAERLLKAHSGDAG